MVDFRWVWKLGFISIRLTQNLHYLTRELGNWSWSSCVFLKAHLYETKTSPNPSNKKKNLQYLYSAFAFSVQISHIFSAGWNVWRKFPQNCGTYPRYPTSRPKKLNDSLHKSVVIGVSWVCFFWGVVEFFLWNIWMSASSWCLERSSGAGVFEHPFTIGSWGADPQVSKHILDIFWRHHFVHSFAASSFTPLLPSGI